MPLTGYPAIPEGGTIANERQPGKPMTKLTDKVIRAALKAHLDSQGPLAVLEELRVHNGNAVADVVSIHEDAHCYEIKGETDEIRRISKQGSYYDLVFSQVTLVTTQNHISTAMRLAPHHWGVIIAEHSQTGVQLRNIRSAQRSAAFDKKLALLTLWKSELLSLLDHRSAKVEKLSRERLSCQIADGKEAHEISVKIGKLLVARQANNGWSLAI